MHFDSASKRLVKLQQSSRKDQLKTVREKIDKRKDRIKSWRETAEAEQIKERGIIRHKEGRYPHDMYI